MHYAFFNYFNRMIGANNRKAYSIKCFILLFLLILNTKLNAQYQEFPESLRDKSSFERRKAVYGFTESKATFLNIEHNRDEFLSQVNKTALKLNDKELVNEIAFIQKKQSEIMAYPPKQREAIILNKIETIKTDLHYLASCYHELGQIYFQESEYEKAFNYDLLSLNTYRTIGFEKVPNLNKILHEIALHHYFFKNYNEVINLMKISLELSPFSPGIDIQRYNNLGLAYSKIEKTDSALFYYKEGLKCAESHNSNIWLGILSSNIAKLHQNQQQLDSALYYSIKNYNYNKEESTHINVKMNAYTSLANLYIELDSINKAEELMFFSRNLVPEINQKLNETLSNSSHLGDRQQMENALMVYYELCKTYNIKTKNYDIALQYDDSLKTIKNKIQSQYNPTVVKLASNQFVLQNALTSIQELENENKKRMLVFYFSIILLITIISFFYIYNFYKRRKKNEELKLNNLKALENKKILEQELAHAQQTLFNFKAKLKEQNIQIEKLEQDILKLTKKSEQKTDLYKAQNLLEDLKKLRILTDQDWVDFQHDFQKLYINLYKKIDNHVPIFTLAEKRFLMLIKLGFNNKEMADAVGVTEGAIRITWKRIREKVGLSIDKSPIYFINELEKE